MGNDTWMAHGYRVNAPNLMEARSQLLQKIHEEAFARVSVASLDQELKIKRAKLGEADRTQTGATVYEVTAHDGQKYRGRLLMSGMTATFEEASTHFRFTDPNEVGSFRSKEREISTSAWRYAQSI